ncbi:MAG: glycosyltransferase family 2 protein [Bacteroidota bacterium]|nr:glycosyltransferase family 2 protein [Bacteroidota bacterium]
MKSSIIICTYNEEKTITDVLISICKHSPDSEIIVVDDGSIDKTESILLELSKEYSFKYEKLDKNRGKSWAMVHGVEKATNEIILFFDADVSNIKKEHFDSLLQPIISSEADMVLGQPSETLIDYKVNPFRALTGERALLKKDIVPILEDIREIRFGVETFINLYFQAKGKRIKYVLLKELVHPIKYKKTTMLNATKEFASEEKEIAITLMNNHDLITNRVELIIKKYNTITKSKITFLQNDINNKMQELKDKFLL